MTHFYVYHVSFGVCVCVQSPRWVKAVACAMTYFDVCHASFNCVPHCAMTHFGVHMHAQ